MYFDAHNHLQDAWLAPHRERVFADLAAAGVRACVVNGTSESDWPEVASLCRFQPSTFNLQLLPSYGLHPWDVGNRTPSWQSHLLAHLSPPQPPTSDPRSPISDLRTPTSTPHLRAPRAPCVGEIGLDRWILDRARPDDPRLAGLRRAPLDEQLEVFRWQLSLAAARNLPASIHCLDAFGPLLDALRSTALPARGFLLHAYSGPAEMVPAFAALGARFSFNGGFLHPRKTRLHSLYATAIPADRLLVETDAPAMSLSAPVGAAFRRDPFTLPPSPTGEPVNHPANLTLAYAGLALLRRTSVDALAAQVSENFSRLFL